jgi:hypothetical protein
MVCKTQFFDPNTLDDARNKYETMEELQSVDDINE